MAGERGGLVRDALHQVAVAGDHEGAVVDDLVPRAVEARGEVPLGERHADGVGEALAERPGGGLDARGVAVLGVARVWLPNWRNCFSCVERQVVPGEVEQAVEQRRAVPGREHEAVAIGPRGFFGLCRIERVKSE